MAQKSTKEDDAKFSLEQLCSSKQFKFRKDALLATFTMEPSKQYTKKEVEEALEAFYKGGTE